MKIDFEVNKLSLLSVESYRQWTERLEDQFVNLGFTPTEEKPGGCTEKQLEAANNEIGELEGRIGERDRISKVEERERSAADRKRLKELPSASRLASDLAELKKERIRLDSKVIEMNKAAGAVDKFVEKTVVDELFESYREKRKEHVGDREKQIREGLKEIIERLKGAANMIAAALRTKVSKEGDSYATSQQGALDKIARIKRIREESETLQDQFGTTVVVSDGDALAALLSGIKSKVGSGNVPILVQAALDVATVTTTTFKALSEKLKPMLEAVQVRDKLDVGKAEEEDGGASFKASATLPKEAVELKLDKLEAEISKLQVENTKHNGLWASANAASAGGGGSGGQQQQSVTGHAFAAGLASQTMWGQGAGNPGRGAPGGRYGSGGGGRGRGRGGVCFDFQKGRCTRGDGCRFEHTAATQAAAGGGANKPVCHYDGTCTNRSCEYDHPRGKARASTPVGTDRKRK